MIRRMIIAVATMAAVASLGVVAIQSSTAGAADAPATTVRAVKPDDNTRPAKGDKRGPGRGPEGDLLAPAATALGITVSDLTKELQAGKSIADVAVAKGVAVDKVVDAIQAAMRPQIASMVNTKGFAPGGPGGPGGRPGGPGDRDDDDDDNDKKSGAKSNVDKEKLKACMTAKGIDPAQAPADEAGKQAKAKALRECIKSTKS
jgi:hypothetical protein